MTPAATGFASEVDMGDHGFDFGPRLKTRYYVDNSHFSLILFRNLPNDSTRVSGREHAVWYISSDHTAGTNDRL